MQNTESENVEVKRKSSYTSRKTVSVATMPAAIEITPRSKNARDWTDSEGHMMDGEGGSGRHSLSPVCLVSPVLTSRPSYLSSHTPLYNESLSQ